MIIISILGILIIIYIIGNINILDSYILDSYI